MCLCVSCAFLALFSFFFFVLSQLVLILSYYYSLDTCLLSNERQNGCGSGWRGERHYL